MARPGQLDQRIKVKRYTLADDGYGGKTRNAPTVLFEAWASVNARGGSEQDRADREQAEATVIFTIRNRRDVTLLETDRIEWQGVEYNIRVPLDQGGRVLYLEIVAERGVAQ